MATILLTGLPKTNAKLANYLREDTLAPEPIYLPLQDLRIIESSKCIHENYDIIAFTSPNAAHLYMEHIFPLNSKLCQYACIGPGTALALEDYGIPCHYMPKDAHNALALAKTLIDKAELKTKKILFPCSVLADNELGKSLLPHCEKFTRLECYRPEAHDKQALPGFEQIVFFSPSSVEIWADYYGKEPLMNKKIFCLGKKTQAKIDEKINISAIKANKESIPELFNTILKEN